MEDQRLGLIQSKYVIDEAPVWQVAAAAAAVTAVVVVVVAQEIGQNFQRDFEEKQFLLLVQLGFDLNLYEKLH